MFRRLVILILSVFLFSAWSIPVSSTTSDAIVLTEVEIENERILSTQELRIFLRFRTPTNFEWNPKQQNITGDLQLIFCPDSGLSGSTCTFPSHISNFRIQNVVEHSGTNFENFIETTVLMSGNINSGLEGQYRLWSIRIAGADLPNRYEMHVYTRQKDFAEELTIPRTDIPVPDLSPGDLLISNEIMEETTQEPTEEIVPEPEIEEIIPEEPPVVVVPPPAPPAGRSQGGGAQPASPVVVNELLEQEVLALPLSGNQVWKPMRGIKGKFENWKVGRKNSINGVNPLFTRTNLSMMTFRTTGDSVSLRYLGGKKRGSFSIYVNGEFIERIDAKTKKKRKLVKTWEGLGEGRHFVDIVAELDLGESIAINGVQRPRLN